MNLSPSLHHAKYELGNILKHPEQLLLILATPISLLVLFPQTSSIFQFTLGACALSSSFVSISINTAFARRYGTLKYMAVTPLGLSGLVVGQTLVGAALFCLQIPISILAASYSKAEIAISLQTISLIPALLLVFSLLSFLFASVLSAEKVLAFANLFFVFILITGFKAIETSWGLVHPLSAFAQSDQNYLQALFTLLIYLATVSVLLRKFFKWLD